MALWSQKPNATKVRGRTGPHSASSQPSGEATGSTAGDGSAIGVLTAFIPLLTAVVERGFVVPTKSATSGSSVPAAVLHSPSRLASSPPPEVDEELTRCLEAFARERRISFQLIDDAIMTLSSHSFTPDAIANVPIERLQQLLPQFAEGQLYGLKRYADEWYSRVTLKRTRRSH